MDLSIPANIDEAHNEFSRFKCFRLDIFFRPDESYNKESNQAADITKRMMSIIGMDNPLLLLMLGATPKTFNYKRKSRLPYGIDVSEFCGGKDPTRLGEVDFNRAVKRLTKSSYWKKIIIKQAKRNSELMQMRLGNVGGKHGPGQCSNFAYVNRQADLVIRENFGEKTQLRNNITGHVMQLPAASRQRLCNMNQHYAEAKGIEKYARTKFYTFIFVTITLPSRFHCNPKNGRNSWDGSSPRDGNQWYTDRWGKFRSAVWKRFGVSFPMYGCKEPMLDATFHVHLMYFIPRDLIPQITALFEEYFANPSEFNGDSSNALKIVKDDGRAAPSTYFLTDIMKGSGVEEYQGTKADSATRVDAWASLWGIRRWFTGGIKKSMGLYNELRRAKTSGIRLPESFLPIQDAACKKKSFHEFLAQVHDKSPHIKLFMKTIEDYDVKGAFRKVIEGIYNALTGEVIITRVGRYIMEYLGVDAKNPDTTIYSYPRKTAGDAAQFVNSG